jgi:hypothetical protein
MAIIQIYTMSIATGASVSEGLNIGNGEFTRFALALPQVTSVFATEAVNTRMQGSPNLGTSWFTIGYSNNPATATSGFKPWEAAVNAWGSMVICEAALFSPYVRLSFTGGVTTQATNAFLFAGKD